MSEISKSNAGIPCYVSMDTLLEYDWFLVVMVEPFPIESSFKNKKIYFSFQLLINFLVTS